MAEKAPSNLDELLSETVRVYPVLYDKSCKNFKDTDKKKSAWQDVAKKVGLPSEKEAETAFKNLRNRYSRDKKKLKSVKISGTGKKEVDDAKSKTSELHTFLAWLEPYIQPRNSASNLVQLNSSEENIERADDSDESSAVSTDPDIVSVVTSKTTGRAKHMKKARTKSKDVETAELEFLETFGQRLKRTEIKEKDEESIFGELIASQLRQLQYHQRTLAKMELNNVMYSHLLRNSKQESNMPTYSSTGNNFTTNVHASNQSSNQLSQSQTPVFQGETPEMPRGQENIYTNMQSVDISNSMYTPGYLFQQYRGHDSRIV